ncbi:helix-turn-helix domain-containing protein [Chryseobacterium vaccae]|uniref:helix-turn-helix domain-containing protein n=1 Tax=Chryseobacterium vaccae TaxID=2604424 RepID=UPI001625D353|nr:helix-turn-helix domain-containing protein [Chryseobacterium vaccae]
MIGVKNIITKEDRKNARTSLSVLRTSIKQVRKQDKRGTVKLKYNEEEIQIPEQAFVLFKSILSNIAEGLEVAVIPSHKGLSTQMAADLLRISRPHLIKLLERGDIPFFKVGTHRRIELEDLENYEEKQKEIREKQLKFLTKQAQDLNLGYE